MMKYLSFLFAAAALVSCAQESSPDATPEAVPDPRVAEIHETTVFVDMHAPSSLNKKAACKEPNFFLAAP